MADNTTQDVQTEAEEIKKLVSDLNEKIKEQNNSVAKTELQALAKKLSEYNEDFSNLVTVQDPEIEDHLLEVISNIEGYQMLVDDASAQIAEIVGKENEEILNLKKVSDEKLEKIKSV